MHLNQATEDACDVVLKEKIECLFFFTQRRKNLTG
jgi:hypothetical protein